MCGIIGVKSKAVSRENFENEILISLKHRGPDFQSFEQIDNFFIGHTRLSIIDLSTAANQPMKSFDGNLILTFNGEIYNYLEIRKELEKRGYSFNSKSDTEVILNAYIEYGNDCFGLFEGMFAISIYQISENKLILVRDPVGIKPLYYFLDDDIIAYSSEVRSFKQMLKNLEFNDDWKVYFLLFGYIPSPFTTYKNVFCVPPGSFIEIDCNTNEKEIFEFNSFQFSSEICKLDGALDSVNKSVFDAVRSNLASDANIGIMLSGGIDSSLICLIANRFPKINFKALSLRFESEYSLEERCQDLVAENLQVDFNYRVVTFKDFSDTKENFFKSLDQPTIDGLNTFFISQFAHEQDCKVLLSGLGADELFGGYSTFKYSIIIEYLKYIPKIFLKLVARVTKSAKLEILSIDSNIKYSLFLRSIFSFSDVEKLTGKSRKEILDALDKVESKHIKNSANKNIISSLEFQHYMRDQLLKDSDVFSMANSVELRVPFLNKAVVNSAFSIRTNIKYLGKNKRVLTDAFKKLLPRDVVIQKKKGFGLPMTDWIQRYLNSGKTHYHFSEEEIKIIESFQKGSIKWSKVWLLLLMKEFEVRN
jgi:asparagine synthase (glutamine-hydrolysing)